MAKVMQSQQQVIVEPWWAKGKIIYVGLGMGLLWWVLTSLLRHYVVEPIACRDVATATACVNAIGVAGSIATVLVAVLGTFLLVRYLQPRPIVITLASAVLLWDLGTLANGLAWWVVLLWGIFFYVACYVLFSMVARAKWLALAIATATVIVVVLRLLLLSW